MSYEQSQSIKKLKTRRSKPKSKTDKSVGHLPQFKVLLLNDPINIFGDVVKAVKELTPIKDHKEAFEKVLEAHNTGVSLLIITHKERAELYKEQFFAHVPPIHISIEPVESGK